jgi:hypothetical protein
LAEELYSGFMEFGPQNGRMKLLHGCLRVLVADSGFHLKCSGFLYIWENLLGTCSHIAIGMAERTMRLDFTTPLNGDLVSSKSLHPHCFKPRGSFWHSKQ